MKTLFLAAKYFAIDDKSKIITINHLIKAINNLSFNDKEVKEMIISELDGYESIDNIEPVLDDLKLDTAKDHEKISFDENITKIKEKLFSKGYSFSDKLTELLHPKDDKSNKNTHKLETVFEISEIKENLKKTIFSQDQAIEVLSDRLVELKYVSNPNTLSGIFFFLGPPATGKTYLAESLSKELDGYSFKQFDMSSFSSSNQGFVLTGSDKTYTNSKEGELTKHVQKYPKSIILFDEIEKAHREIQNTLLQVMARGKVQDDHTLKIVDFSEVIFIFTSNLGSELYNNSSFLLKMKEDYQNAQTIILEAISREKYQTSSDEIPKLKPEFLSRVSQGDVILFNKLSFNSFLTMAMNSFEKYQKSIYDKLGLDVQCKELKSLLSILVLSFTPMVDARRIKSKLSISVMDKITDFIRDYEEKSEIDFENLSVEIKIDKSILEFIKQHKLDDDKISSKFLHERFRKNETVTLYDEIKLVNNQIIVTYMNPYIKKLPKSSDYSDQEGSLVFEIPEISFENIAGHKYAKSRLNEIVKYLKNPEELKKFNVEMPKGMILYGPPGTGKTMLARAFAHEAELPFISTTGTEILDINLMKKIFKRAKEYAPSIIFIDEIDAIGYRDGSRADVVINQFLTELNGFSDNPDESIFVISATNFKNKIDPAILRSGRIDLHVKIDKLDKDARAYFIDKLLEKPNDGKIDREKLIKFSFDMSGADLEKVSREASLEVIRKGKDVLTQDILLEQINIVKYGERLTIESLEQLVESTAYHEAAHAVLSKMLMPQVDIEQITVTPRNDALGFVSYNSENNISNLTYQSIRNKICVLYAGRVSQIKKYGELGIDSGASSDLEMATKYLNLAVGKLGMDKKIGYINTDGLEQESIIGGDIEKVIQKRIQELIIELQSETEILVEQYWDKIELVAKTLIEKEFLDQDEFLELIK